MSKPTFRWEYQHANGTPAGYVVRYDNAQGKDIVPHFISDGAGGFNKGAPPVPRLLYGLVSALTAGVAPVFITEGEKCAAALQGLGLIAVASLGGSNAPHLTDWAPITPHVGPIYLLPDNDKAGEAYATKVVELVNHHNLRFVGLPSLLDGGDVVDWLKARHPTWDEYQPLADILAPDELAATRTELLRLCNELGTPPPATSATSATDDGPIPLRPEPLPEIPFPLESLGSLAPVITALADVSNTPIAMCGQSVLAVCSLAVQGLADVQHPAGYSSVLGGFFLTIAKSGDGKSSCDRWAMLAIRERQKELRKEYDKDYQRWEIQHKVWSKREQAILKQAKKNTLSDNTESELNQLGAEPKPPLKHLLVCEEPTFEGLCKAFQQGQPSQGIFTDEGGQFFGGHGMAEEARTRTIASLSRFWGGDDVNRVRATTESYTLTGKRLSIHLMLQPVIANEVLGSNLLQGQGFMARFYISAPSSQMRLFRPPSEKSKAILQQFKEDLLKILRMPYPLDENSRNELAPPVVALPMPLQPRWEKFQHSMERHRHNDDNPYACVSELAAKAGEMALRLSAVLALKANPDAKELDEAALDAGISLTTYYVDEAARLHANGTTNPDIALAEKLLKWLHDNRMESVSIRDICRLGPNRLRDKAKADKTTTILVTHRYLEPLPEKGRFKVLSQKSQASQGGY